MCDCRDCEEERIIKRRSRECECRKCEKPRCYKEKRQHKEERCCQYKEERCCKYKEDNHGYDKCSDKNEKIIIITIN
jgi:hypothetical protein